MDTYKKAYFFAFLAAFMLFLPVSIASADGGRFFVKSTNGLVQGTIGARNVFGNGFTADLSDFQIGLLRLFRVEVEPVAELHILPDDQLPTVSVTPIQTPVKPRAITGKKGNVVRYLPSDQTPWGIGMLYSDPNITRTSGGVGIKVAVLDSGVNKSHPDLANRIGGCKDFTNFRFAVVDDQCDDKNGHGTHVAGIIAADSGSDNLGIYGVAPQASIMAYKVCGTTGSCYADDIAVGLRRAVDDGAKVINMSFGTDSDVEMISDAVNYAAGAGVLMVAAAGNDGPDIDSIDYPAAYSSVIAVGAIDQSRAVTSWSSRGNNLSTTIGTIEDRDIELAAPGDNIESTWKNGGYAILSGTSMASPFVAGLAAKLWQAGGATATRDYLHSLAHDLSPADEDNDSGLGLPLVPLP